MEKGQESPRHHLLEEANFNCQLVCRGQLLICPQMPQEAEKGQALLLEALLAKPALMLLHHCWVTTLLSPWCGEASQTTHLHAGHQGSLGQKDSTLIGSPSSGYSHARNPSSMGPQAPLPQLETRGV